LGWNTRRIFMPARQMMGVLDDGTSGIPASLGEGTPLFAEVLAASELAGMPMGAEGDEVYTMFPIPWDMDVHQPMRFRVWFVHASTDADSVIWKLDYKFFAKQAAITDARSSADENLTFATHVCSTTDDSIEVTAWAESNSHDYWRSGDFGILLALECDDYGDAAANEVILLGLEMQYTVRAMSNNHRQVTEQRPTTGTEVND